MRKYFNRKNISFFVKTFNILCGVQTVLKTPASVRELLTPLDSFDIHGKHEAKSGHLFLAVAVSHKNSLTESCFVFVICSVSADF